MVEIIANQGITDLILAISNEMNHGMFQSIPDCAGRGHQPDYYDRTPTRVLSGRVPIDLLENQIGLCVPSLTAHLPVVFTACQAPDGPGAGSDRTYRAGDPLPFACPRNFLLDSGRPIIFTQQRLGRGGKPYTILKLRTMKSNSDMEKESAGKLPPMILASRASEDCYEKPTWMNCLRSSNVLRGEMSFVGPRSERVELVRVFQKEVPFYRARMLVKTGYHRMGQIHQAYAETIAETVTKLQYDLYYIEHASI